MRFPSPTEEQALHERVLRRESLATQEVFEVFMPAITAALCKNPKQSKEDAHDAVIDVIYSYLRNPERYDAQKAQLSKYLTHAAKKKLLDLYRSQEARSRREREFGGIFELHETTPKNSLELILEAKRAVERIKNAQLPDTDLAVIELVIQGERSTVALAAALKLPPMPAEERRREVKRNRDRLMKILGRLGKEDEDDDA